MSVEKKTAREPCCSKLKMFLAAMCFVYFAKAFQGSYMKSSITQIERRFDIPSSLIGFIDGSFEIGNLFVIAFVSYFGAKLHRPRLIGAGCLIMAMGSFITAAPHFFQGLYKYETTISYFSASNGTESILPCLTSGSLAQDEIPTVEIQAECEKAASSSLWLCVFLGNMLRGVGETPVMPLGLSYLDDFSRAENTALYMALIQTMGIMGPMFGFMLGSFCALRGHRSNSRWVGAWRLGFLLTGGVMLLAGIPFWFLPKSLPKQGETETVKKSNVVEGEQEHFIPDNNKHSNAPNTPAPVSMAALAKDFLPSLKKLFSNTIYIILIITTIIQVNGFIGLMTFQPKYMEQTYGHSASRQNTLISQCNMACSCSLKHWDPICAASNGLTYASPCLAGCQTSTGVGKEMVFHNCTCIGDSPFPYANMSAVLGQCPRKSDCDYMFKFYMAVTIIGSFFPACAATPGYIILLRSINPELKSLALGVHILLIRTLGGIPPAIYFGALIDRTCLKWGTKQCGGRGACRIYDSIAFRNSYLGVIYGLFAASFVLCGVLYNRLSHREKKRALKSQLKAPEQDGNGVSTGNRNVSSAIIKCDENPDQETTI
uniref:Solute carrier organic anion transporter family member n=1 Tax=Sinocyclocheilus rhinocerous TaxID=307959 RepID=A0A673IWC0_9TELE